MYIPNHFAATPEILHGLLTRPSAATLVTTTAQGLLASLLPFHFDPSVGERGALQAHVARNNVQWSEPALGEALAIVQGPDAYISPSWYAAKAEHGRVVPTWNYVTAHVYGKLVIRDDVEWLGRHVRALSGANEAGFAKPWAVDDAPARYVAGQLRAIVGLELVVTRIEAKAKLSQNRPEEDLPGIVAGLQGRGCPELAADVEHAARIRGD